MRLRWPRGNTSRRQHDRPHGGARARCRCDTCPSAQPRSTISTPAMRDDPLIIDKWLSLQAAVPGAGDARPGQGAHRASGFFLRQSQSRARADQRVRADEPEGVQPRRWRRLRFRRRQRARARSARIRSWQRGCCRRSRAGGPLEPADARTAEAALRRVAATPSLSRDVARHRPARAGRGLRPSPPRSCRRGNEPWISAACSERDHEPAPYRARPTSLQVKTSDLKSCKFELPSRQIAIFRFQSKLIWRDAAHPSDEGVGDIRTEARHGARRSRERVHSSDSIKGLAQSIAKPAYRRLLTAEPALRRAVPALIIAFLLTICVGAIVQVLDHRRQAISERREADRGSADFLVDRLERLERPKDDRPVDRRLQSELERTLPAWARAAGPAGAGRQRRGDHRRRHPP